MTKTILFVHYGDDWIRGSERCLLDLIRYVCRRNYRPIVWTNNRDLIKQLGVMGIDTQYNEFPLLLGWKAPRFDIATWFNLIEQGCNIIKQYQADLVHVNSAAPCQWMAASARITGTPLVTQLHCSYTIRDRLTLGIHASPNIISVSNHVAHSVLKDGYPKSQLHVIHNGIDTKLLESQPCVNAKQQLGLDSESFLFATVGSLIRRKGVDRLIKALRHVTLEYPHAHLLIIGDGPLRDRLETHVDYLHLNEHVHFVGEQDNVVGWLKGCDAFVSGARSEAFGLVIAEASLAKIPVIAPQVGGIPEFVKHGETGVLYPNTGPAIITKAMRIAIKKPKLCHQLAQNAYQHIVDHHDIDVSCHKIVKVYRAMLTGEGKTRVGLIRTLLPLRTFVNKRLNLGGQHG